MRDPKLGIGKQEEDDYYTAEENIQRRKLDIEVEETDEVARKREVFQQFVNLVCSLSMPVIGVLDKVV